MIKIHALVMIWQNLQKYTCLKLKTIITKLGLIATTHGRQKVLYRIINLLCAILIRLTTQILLDVIVQISLSRYFNCLDQHFLSICSDSCVTGSICIVLVRLHLFWPYVRWNGPSWSCCNINLTKTFVHYGVLLVNYRKINHLSYLITFEIKIEFRSKRKGEKGEKENRKKERKRKRGGLILLTRRTFKSYN